MNTDKKSYQEKNYGTKMEYGAPGLAGGILYLAFEIQF
jgi:hypothetical protein